MHPPPPDAPKLAEAFKGSNPAYRELIAREGWLRAQRAKNISWKQTETLFLQEFGVKISYSTLRRFLAETDRLRAAWAEAPADPAPFPGADLPGDEPEDTAEGGAMPALHGAREAELSALRAEACAREERIAAQQREIAVLRQRTHALEAERDALAAQAESFGDAWPPDPGAKLRGFALGLLAGLVLAALALAAWWLLAETPRRGIAAFADISGFAPALPDWRRALRTHRTFLYVEAAAIAAGLLCGLGALRAGALGMLVWLTYSAMLHRQYGAFWILLFLTVRVGNSLLSARRGLP